MLLLEHLLIQEAFFLEDCRVCFLVSNKVSLCSIIMYMCMHLYANVKLLMSLAAL